MKKLIKKLERLKICHRQADDGFIDCDEKVCICGADKHNQLVDEIIKELKDNDIAE